MKFFIAGVRFHDLPKVIRDVKVGEELNLVPEFDNAYDPNAVKIMRGETFCGYVPKIHSSEVSMLLSVSNKDEVKCTVTSVNPKANPWEMCEVEISIKEEPND